MSRRTFLSLGLVCALGTFAGISQAGDLVTTCLDTAAQVKELRLRLNPDGGAEAQWCGSSLTGAGARCAETCTAPTQLGGARRTTALNAMDAGYPDYKATAGFP